MKIFFSLHWTTLYTICSKSTCFQTFVNEKCRPSIGSERNQNQSWVRRLSTIWKNSQWLTRHITTESVFWLRCLSRLRQVERRCFLTSLFIYMETRRELSVNVANSIVATRRAHRLFTYLPPCYAELYFAFHVYEKHVMKHRASPSTRTCLGGS